MHSQMERADKALELADWLRSVEGDDISGLMARAASLLEHIAEDEAGDDGLDVVPDIVPTLFCAMPRKLPMALNDNSKSSRRRTTH